MADCAASTAMNFHYIKDQPAAATGPKHCELSMTARRVCTSVCVCIYCAFVYVCASARLGVCLSVYSVRVFSVCVCCVVTVCGCACVSVCVYMCVSARVCGVCACWCVYASA